MNRLLALLALAACVGCAPEKAKGIHLSAGATDTAINANYERTMAKLHAQYTDGQTAIRHARGAHLISQDTANARGARLLEQFEQKAESASMEHDALIESWTNQK